MINRPEANNWTPLALALVWDWFLGEPPDALHPVAWLGQLVTTLEQHAPHDAPRAELLYGGGITVLTVGVAASIGYGLERSLQALRRSAVGAPIGAIGLGMLLKTTFAARALLCAGTAVQHPLQAGDLPAARQALRALVSRDTAQLDPSQLAAAAIESLAENASDSFVAPLLYYYLLGLGGACAYRAVNTLDAMLGYHGRYEFLGKVPARLDDTLNWLPARLTGLLIVAAASLAGARPRQAWRVLRQDHARTASPNAGYPMSAIAGALGICLEKVGHYRLHATGRPPTPADIQYAARLVSLTFGLTVIGLRLHWMCRRSNDARS